MLLLCIAYFAALALLSVYGLHRLWMVVELRRFGCPVIQPEILNSQLPKLAVQLPIYNEGAVVERLLESVSALQYPKDRLEIQVLDDSTDDSRLLVLRKVRELQARGISISLLTRAERRGFKAGALRDALAHTDAELIAVFDADFLPPQDILLRIAPHFSDPGVGMVQTRWGHLNRGHSLFTRGQGLLIDGHFMVEHAARFRTGAFFNFNGTAGVWRRKAIEDAGGWQADTLTEDLDLSYRAQLCGWRFIYRRDLVTPAELPETISAFKSQQYRWTKGSAQVFRKLIIKILCAEISSRKKFEAFMHLSGNFCFVYALVAALLFVPLGVWRARHGFFLGGWVEFVLCVSTLSSMINFYRYAALSQGLKLRLADMLSALTLGIGMAAHCAFASLSGLLGRETGEFVRTPKRGNSSARLRADNSLSASGLGLKELLISAYLIVGMFYIYSLQDLLFAPFGLLLLAGYIRVGFAGVKLRF